MTSFCSKNKTVVQISYKNSNDAAKLAFMNMLHRETFHVFLIPPTMEQNKTKEKANRLVSVLTMKTEK